VDAEGSRPIVRPTVGDVIITELMPNPAGLDADREWLELLVARDVDLGGVEIAAGPDGPRYTLGDDGACWRVRGGTHLVLARRAAAAENGGLAGVDAPLAFGLGNDGGDLRVSSEGALIDAVSYDGAAVEEGRSLSLAPLHTDPVDNDDAASWCPAGGAAYGPGGAGSPGAPNPACDPAARPL
jgi:hypothetical protein